MPRVGVMGVSKEIKPAEAELLKVLLSLHFRVTGHFVAPLATSYRSLFSVSLFILLVSQKYLRNDKSHEDVRYDIGFLYRYFSVTFKCRSRGILERGLDLCAVGWGHRLQTCRHQVLYL